MIRFLKPLALSCALALAGSGAFILLQDEPTTAQEPASREKVARITGVINETLRLARISDIYSEVRYAAREYYLPYYENFAAKLAETGADPVQIRNTEAVTRLLSYSLAASDELEPVLDDQSDDIIADYAAVFARHLDEDQINLIAEFQTTPAARKLGNIIYAYSRIITGYNKADFDSLDEIVDLALTLDIDMKDNPFTPDAGPPPSADRVNKASAIIFDVMRISRLDEMVGKIVSFGRNSVLKIDTLTPDERAQIENGIRQIEFYYNLGKSMAVAVAPSALASAADLDDLDKLHRIVLAPAFATSFSLIENLVREVTAFSAPDLQDMKTFCDEADAIEARTGFDDDQLNEELDELSQTWTQRLFDSLSPETRLGLEQAMRDAGELADESKRQIERYNNNNQTEL